MPSSLAATHVLKDIVFLPIRLWAESLPSGCIKCWSIDSPAAIGEILKIQLAVVEIHCSLQRANGVKALDNLIASRP